MEPNGKIIPAFSLEIPYQKQDTRVVIKDSMATNENSNPTNKATEDKLTECIQEKTKSESIQILSQPELKNISHLFISNEKKVDDKGLLKSMRGLHGGGDICKYINKFERDLPVDERNKLVSEPIPKELGVIHLTIKEDKPNFVLVFSDEHQFILWAHKESWTFCTKYRISTDHKKTKTHNLEYIAKLKANLLGTYFDLKSHSCYQSPIRTSNLIASITYAYSFIREKIYLEQRKQGK